MPDKDRPIRRGERLTARRLEALRLEAIAGRNVRHGTNTSGLQTGAGASSISKDTITELVEIRQVMPVDEWIDDKPVLFAIGNLTQMTDATTGKVLYYRCKFAHWSGLGTEPGTLGGAAKWTLVYTPYQVYILDAQSGAQTHEYQPVFIDDGGIELPQFTKGYMGTGASGDKFMLPSRERVYNICREWALIIPVTATPCIWRQVHLIIHGNQLVGFPSPVFGTVTGLIVNCEEWLVTGGHLAGLVDFVVYNKTTGGVCPQPGAPQIDNRNPLTPTLPAGYGVTRGGSLAVNFEDMLELWLRCTISGMPSETKTQATFIIEE